MDDSELDSALNMAKSGEEAGVTLLYRNLQPFLIAYLRNRTGSSCEDVSQETWISAIGALRNFEGRGGDFKALLFDIAHKRVVDFYRKESRRPKITGINESIDIPGNSYSVENMLDDVSSQEAISKLVSNLTSDQAEVVLLRVIGGLSTQKVAKIMGKSVGSVRILQHRAVEKISKSQIGVTI
ncbi:MAG: RNA polymerase sigma factor [Acidimicrobiales bacterium]|nr:RNA polymerase sigma factor [Acidimicrobiales bacterium]